jgi:hypothetical protein
MMIPPVFTSASVIPAEQRKQEHQCVCGRPVDLDRAYATWTHPRDSGAYDWFAVCNQTCFTRHCSEGNA